VQGLEGPGGEAQVRVEVREEERDEGVAGVAVGLDEIGGVVE